jgi:hypothetical protein
MRFLPFTELTLTFSSTDRVFVHALNTVKKIPRTGTARPPPEERLKLYGLYKQSMGKRAREALLIAWSDVLPLTLLAGIHTEGDVEGIMDRPTGDGVEAQAERGKW